MPEVWCWYKNGYGWNRSSWSAVRVDAGKHVDFCRGSVLSTAEGVELLILRPTRHTSAHVNFCRGSVLSTAERSRVTYFTTDKAYERAAVSQGGVGKRWKDHGVFLRYSYSLGLILPLLASDTPVLALDVLRA